jgi:SAM-dependent methyltransferase
MNVREHNRIAWDAQVERGNRWSVPVSDDAIAAARRGAWKIVLTPRKSVPRAWLAGVEHSRILCLASGGGQQGPILAAAGAKVTVLDNSPKQLERDVALARAHALDLRAVQGDMADLTAFPDDSFDLIVHPVSNCFVVDVRPVWAEAFRVLCPGGRLLAGFTNPILYLFDQDPSPGSPLVVQHRLPYSDVESLTPEAVAKLRETGTPLEFGHTLEDQIGGQLAAGFIITGMYEDRDDPDRSPLSEFTSTFLATCAVKPDKPAG